MAGSKSAALSNDILLLIFNAGHIDHIAEDTATAPCTNLYVALHTSEPTVEDQTDHEVTVGQYATYARVAVARSGAGWTVTTGSVVPAADIEFPTSKFRGDSYILTLATNG